MKKAPLLLTVMMACASLYSCTPTGSKVSAHQFDTVTFRLTDPPPVSGKPVATVWLDTRLKADGFFGGGTVKSQKPYHIRIDYTDTTSTYTALQINTVKVVYDDGKVEGGVDELTLPHRIPVRDYETVNSTNGGQIVKETVKILSGSLENVIHRDESLTLEIEGFFATAAGTKQPFTINDHYTVSFDKGARPLQDR